MLVLAILELQPLHPGLALPLLWLDLVRPLVPFSLRRRFPCDQPPSQERFG